jgi:replicative DNA helicase
MSIELNILKTICINRPLFEKYNPYVTRETGLDKEIKVLFYVVQKYYDKYKKQYITKNDICLMFEHMYPQSKDRHIYMEVIDRMWSLEPNPDLIEDNLEAMMEKHTANDIINKLAEVVEGNKTGTLPEIQDILDDHVKKLRNPPKESTDLEAWDGTVEDLVKKVYNVSGYKFPKALPRLDHYIGTLPPKKLGAIFAYSDRGKTSFGIRCAVTFAWQMEQGTDPDAKVAYCGNEEDADTIALRMVCGCTSTHRDLVAKNYKWYDKEARRYGFNRIKIYDRVTHIKQVEKLLDKVRPKVMFIDQGTKIAVGYGPASGDVKDLQILFNIYRELAKQYDCTIICLAQANGSKQDAKLLTLADIYGSRIAIQGELDFAIGIGGLSEDHKQYEQYKNSRWFNVCKNKLKNGDKGACHSTFDKDRLIFKGA